MNEATWETYREYLDRVNDPVAAASLTLADTMAEGHREPSEPPQGLPTALKVAEVATRLKITRKTVYALCRTRRIRCYRAGRSLRIPVEEVERFENFKRSQRRGPALPGTSSVPPLLIDKFYGGKRIKASERCSSPASLAHAPTMPPYPRQIVQTSPCRSSPTSGCGAVS